MFIVDPTYEVIVDIREGVGTPFHVPHDELRAFVSTIIFNGYDFRVRKEKSPLDSQVTSGTSGWTSFSKSGIEVR